MTRVYASTCVYPLHAGELLTNKPMSWLCNRSGFELESPSGFELESPSDFEPDLPSDFEPDSPSGDFLLDDPLLDGSDDFLLDDPLLDDLSVLTHLRIFEVIDTNIILYLSTHSNI